ncbi:MAG TPA: SDR family oxidoreductase [Burkholderiales bacterium]|nr:SDR family oxidoreductase [Burkholderiales bacterium]
MSQAIVITGASSGFGKGAALRFAQEKASLVLAARRGELLEDLAMECRSAGARALAVPTDVSREDEVERLAQAALREFGRIDVWINNAGVGALGRFERIPLADHRQVIATNLLGTLYGSWLAYRQFLQQGSGILINIASELGGHTVPYYSSYAAAKHGVVGLGDSLRQELAQNGIQGVHVCTVMPSAHDTPFFDHAANYTGHEVQAPKPLHDPENVVETLVRLARDPRDKEVVGKDGTVKILMKKLAPHAEERMAARYIHRLLMEKSPPAADSPGAVRTPMREGTGVSAGRLK